MKKSSRAKTPTPSKEPDEIKTTILLPAALWTRAKILATNHRTSLRDVLITALEEHLAKAERR